MNNDLIDRYIYAVTRRLPHKARADIDAELRGLIEDMLEEKTGGLPPSPSDIHAVLAKLGTPGELAEKYQAMPFGRFLAFAAGLVTPIIGSRQRHVDDGTAVGAVARFRVAPQIADKNHFVDRSHVISQSSKWVFEKKRL